VRLEANHRCTEEIVAAAAAVLGDRGRSLRAAGRRGPEPDVRLFPSERAEAAGIAAAVARSRREGRRFAEMAVLARTNAQLDTVHDALTAAGIPVRSAARAARLDDPVVRDHLAGFGSRRELPVRAAIADLREAEAQAAPADRDGIQALLELIQAYRAIEPEATVGAWLAWLPTAVGDRSAGGRSEAVMLSSFHRAKGLEWDWVWLAGLEEGLVPMGRGGPESEERQLFYVALTRAETELHLSWAETRCFGNRPVPRQPSRWLEAIALAARPAAEPEQPGGWRPRWSGQRESLRRQAAVRGRPLGPRTPPSWPDPDPQVLAALRAWRLEAARNSGVPPHVLLHDVTIEALAALRPTTVEELLAVPGLGPVKAGRYGQFLLAAVASSPAPEVSRAPEPA
jgi:DNA helicase-2/ATP-dependent DNA helicase PcrA